MDGSEVTEDEQDRQWDTVEKMQAAAENGRERFNDMADIADQIGVFA